MGPPRNSVNSFAQPSSVSKTSALLDTFRDEISCHSHLHRLVYSLSPDEFRRRDTRQAVAAIENAWGVTPRVYRAPRSRKSRFGHWKYLRKKALFGIPAFSPQSVLSVCLFRMPLETRKLKTFALDCCSTGNFPPTRRTGQTKSIGKEGIACLPSQRR